MRVRRIDKNGDWTFGQSRNNYAAESEAIAQNVLTRLRSFEGDWFLDLEHGLPWFEHMEKPANLNLLRQSIRRQVAETQGVAVLSDLDVSYDPEIRKVQVELSYQDIFYNRNTLSSQL